MSNECKESFENIEWWRRAAGDVQVNRYDIFDCSSARVAAGEHAAIGGAITQGDDPFW